MVDKMAKWVRKELKDKSRFDEEMIVWKKLNKRVQQKRGKSNWNVFVHVFRPTTIELSSFTKLGFSFTESLAFDLDVLELHMSSFTKLARS